MRPGGHHLSRHALQLRPAYEPLVWSAILQNGLKKRGAAGMALPGGSSLSRRTTMAIPHDGKPEDVAAAVAFLTAPAARHITGTGILVDGGANA
jgi:NAD(P)-dependent dehydrogenase (short-subunit alcohol dehydrogenase family)